MQRPTLRQLEYYLALAERLNFREAAESCLVSQPALSSQIAQLEGNLGVKLFERTKRVVRLTAEGEHLLARAKEVVNASDGLVDLARSLGEPLAGPLRLGAIPTVGPYLLPKVLPRVRETHSDLKLFLREDTTGNLLEQLEAGEQDILLLAIDVPLGNVATMPLFSDPFLVGMPAGDPLAAKDELELGDLVDRDVLLLEEGHCLRDQTLPLCEASGASDEIGFRASSLSTVTQMVAGGMGITLLPELAVEREALAAPNLRTVGFGADGPYRSVGLAWRKSSPREAEFRQLGETMAQAYAQA